MKQSKRIAAFVLAICFIFALAACNNSEQDDFTSLQSFEYHFYPEEYEEEYNTYEKAFTLESDTDYQFQINAICEKGTIKICFIYENAENKTYIVNSSAPCNDTITIPANTTNTVSFTITITHETNGNIVVETLTRQQ